ncbi:uncharacterized protein LOC144287839 isoform X5 [Canis aureus]
MTPKSKWKQVMQDPSLPQFSYGSTFLAAVQREEASRHSFIEIKCELYKEKEVFLLLLHLQYCKKGLYEFDKAFHGLYSKDDQILIFLLQMKDESEDKVIVVDRIIKWKEPQDLIPSPPWRRSTRLNTNLSHIC